MTLEPTPDRRGKPPIDSGQLIAAPQAEAHALFIHKTASTLADRVAIELGRGGYLPNEREAIYITNELCSAMNSIIAMRCCHYSSVENPIAIWDHVLIKPTKDNEIAGPNEEVVHWTWKANHLEMLNTFVRFVREARHEGIDPNEASQIALKRFMLYAINSEFKTISNGDDLGFVAVEDAISTISPPSNFVRLFEQEIQTSKSFGAVSSDCSDECDENSHAELVRMRRSANSMRLQKIGENFNLQLAPELSLYSLTDSRELFRNTNTALRGDPATRRNIAYVATSEALRGLKRDGEPTSLDNVLKKYAQKKAEFEVQLARLESLRFSEHVVSGSRERIEFYAFLLQVIPEQRPFLEGALDCR